MYTVYVLTFLKQESPKALLGMHVPRSKGSGKRGHIVVDTLLLMMFLGRANARDTK